MEISELQLQSAGVAHWCMYEMVVNQVFTAANVPHTRCLGWHDPSVKSSAHYEYQCALKQQPYIFTKQPSWGAVPVASEYVVVGIPW